MLLVVDVSCPARSLAHNNKAVVPAGVCLPLSVKAPTTLGWLTVLPPRPSYGTPCPDCLARVVDCVSQLWMTKHDPSTAAERRCSFAAAGAAHGAVCCAAACGLLYVPAAARLVPVWCARVYARLPACRTSASCLQQRRRRRRRRAPAQAPEQRTGRAWFVRACVCVRRACTAPLTAAAAWHACPDDGCVGRARDSAQCVGRAHCLCFDQRARPCWPVWRCKTVAQLLVGVGAGVTVVVH